MMGNCCSQRRRPITHEKENFTRFGKAIVGIGTNVLQDILETYIPSKDIAIKVTSSSYPYLWGRLNPQQRLLIGQAATDGYKDFDITLCYALLRNLNVRVHAPFCPPFPKPTRGWGNQPLATDTTQSDDIERIRILRNERFGHRANPSIPIVEFTDIWNQLRDVCTRMKARLPKGRDFLKELRTLESCHISSVQWDSIVKVVKQMREYSNQIDEHNTQLATLDKEVDRHDTQLDEQSTQLATLDKEVDRHDTQLDEHSTQLATLDKEVDRHDTQLDEHSTQLATLDIEVDRHDTQLDEHSTQLATLDKEVDRHDTQLDEHSTQLATLDIEVDRHDTQLDEHSTHLATLDKEVDRHDTQLDEHSTQLATLDIEVDRHDTQLDEHSTQLATMDKEVDRHETQLDEHSTQLDTLDKEVDRHDTQLDEHSTQLATLDTEVDRHDTQLDEHSTQLATLDKEVDRHDTQLDEHSTQLATLDKEVDRHDTQLDEHSTHLATLDTEVDRHDTQLDEHSTQLATLDKEVDRHDTQLDEHSTQLATLDKEVDRHDTQLDEHSTHLATLDTEVDRHDTQLDEHSTQLATLDKEVDRHDTQLDEHSTQLATLDTEVDRHDTQLDEHSTHLATLDIEVDRHDTQLDEHSTQLATLDTEVDRHDTQLDEHSTQLDRLDTGVQSHGSQLDEHERHLDSLDESCQNHETQIANIKKELKSDQHKPDEEPDVRKLKERLIKANDDLTKVITLSPLQERGRELPIELLFSQVVIREGKKYREKGDNSEGRFGIDTSKQLPVRDCGVDKNTDWKFETDSNHDYESVGHSTRLFSETLSEDKKELLNPDDIFKAEDEVANSIYMLGDAAHGKTTYCLWLAKKWCNAQQEDSLGRELDVWETALKKFDFVFLLQFRNVNPNRACVVDMICHDVSKSLKGCHAAIRHVLSSEKYRSLVIMDGLDEWNPNEQTRKQLTCQGMPNLDELSSTVTTFISMRPWVLAVISKLVQGNDIVIEILGLSETGMEEVIKNMLINRYRLTENSSKFNDVYNRIRMNLKEKSLKSFMQIPLLAVVCVQIWYEGKQIGDSMTRFYAEMLNMLIERADEKHELEIENEQSINCRLPELLSRHENVRSCISVLLKLGKVAYEGLISKKTNLVFQKKKLENEIGERDLQFILDVGLISHKEADSLVTKNLSIHFFHKSIQEFLAVIYIITNKEVGDSFCKHLSSVQAIMELSNVIMFICGMSPSLGSVISQHAVRVTDSDTTICGYREFPGHNSCVEGLCEIQIGWYRELQDRETESPVTFHISDVYHNVDVEKMSVIRKIFSDHNVLGIRSLYLKRKERLGVPTVSESSITNTELNDFLLNKYNNTRSLVKVCINGPYCVPTIFIPTLRNLHLIHVSIDNSHHDVDICPPFFTHASSLRALWLFNVTVGNRGLDLSKLTSLRFLNLTDMTLGDKGLDLSAMTSLQELSLDSVPLGERGLYLSTNMVNLKKVDLSSEVMSAAQWEQFILSALNIQHRFDLELWSTNIDDESITRIRSSPHFNVTRENRDVSSGGKSKHRFFFTRVTRYDDDGNEILYTRLQEKPNITQ